MFHYVYVIQHTFTKQIYIGYTHDLRRRIQEHNLGLQKATQRKGGKWILVYCEVYRRKEDAILREKKLKQHGSNLRWLKDRIKHSLLKD
jgi:putative endonuclease